MPNIFGAVETVEPGEVVGGAAVGPDLPVYALYVLSGGTIISTELLSGGFVDVYPGATAINTIFSGDSFSRGLEVVYGVDSEWVLPGVDLRHRNLQRQWTQR